MSSPQEPYPQTRSDGYGQAPYPPGGGGPSHQGYLQGAPVGFGEAISEGFKNVLTFSGRASRSAFWWFFLGVIIIDLIAAILGRAVHHAPMTEALVGLIMFLASLSVAVRRLHDSGKSGFWLFIGLVPVVGGITLLVFDCLPGTPGPNQYNQQA